MIGQDIRRKEDLRLVTGQGQFADDLVLEDAVHAVFVRSPHAHARIAAIDTAAALAMPGVLAVFTGADMLAAGISPIPHIIGSAVTGSDIPMRNHDGTERARTPHLPLPVDRARYVGEAVVMVIAQTANLAKDAAEQILVDWEELPSVVQGVEALGEGAPVIWGHVPGNLALEGEVGDKQATEAAFASAAHVVRFSSWVQRVTGVHMEPRSSAASYDAATGRYTVHASGGQGVVIMRDQIAASLGVEPDRLRVVAPCDVGGNFGTRNAVYPEFVLLAHASRLVGRPVRHLAERIEAFLSDYQGRDLHVEARLALDKHGRFLAFHSVNTANLGAHTVSYTALNKGIQLMTSLYRVPAAHVEFRAALSNTVPTIPYRSAGRPEAMYAIERMIDLAARQCGFDRLELRRINMVVDGDMAYTNAMGLTYDNGDYLEAMDKVLDMADWAGFETRRAEALARGRYRGIGFSNYIEGAGGVPRERADITVDPVDSMVDVIIGTQNTGQGHETAFAQLVGSFLGISHERVRIRTSDTDFVMAGGGSHSGRSLRFSSIVMHKATAEIIERGKAIAAYRLGVTAQEVDHADGHFRVANSNDVMDLFEVAAAASDPDMPEDLRGSLRAVSDETTPGLAFPYGAAVCEIEIDPETGLCTIPRYSSVDDVGRALNPMIVDGQTHGGIVQGVGQALFEWCHYDGATGQNLSASFMDYQVGRAGDFPGFDTHISEVPSRAHPLGFRPGGEGGTTPALGVTVNAIADALSPLGIAHIEMPVTPQRIWQAIQAATAD